MAEKMARHPHLFDTYSGPVSGDNYMLVHWLCHACNRHHVSIADRRFPVVFPGTPKDVVCQGIDRIVQREEGLF